VDELKHMLDEVQDYFVKQYMDLENGQNMELKRQVLEALLEGKTPPEIPGYDDVLDKWTDAPIDISNIQF
jgi:hypothetical protein